MGGIKQGLSDCAGRPGRVRPSGRSRRERQKKAPAWGLFALEPSFEKRRRCPARVGYQPIISRSLPLFHFAHCPSFWLWSNSLTFRK